VPTPIPARERKVFFVGAGLSCALGLPNTAMLLDGVLDLASTTRRWGQAERLDERLKRAFEFFYPDAVHDGYMPDVVDFFSALRTYLDVGADLAGGFRDAPALYRTLKGAIAHLLMMKLRACERPLRTGHEYLDEMLQPDNIIVTSNWDLVLERYAQLHHRPVRLSGSGPGEVTLLKLHGSIDWCLGSHMRLINSRFAMLNDLLFNVRPYRHSLPPKSKRSDIPVRIRAIEEKPGSAWPLIRRSASDLLMVTMVRGKSGDLGPLRDIWRSAYGALSRAKRLEIVGYSMPPDDIEIRTLMRAGVQRGANLEEIVVRNPSPEVHERIRRYLDRNVESDYRGVAPC
jgi:hypothetical protein